MTAPKRLPQQVEADLAFIARYYLRGYHQAEIAKRLIEDRDYSHADKTVQTWVGLALKELHKRWLEAQLLDFDAAKAKELARLDQLEQAYWQAWERSILDASEVETEMVHDEQGQDKPGATYSRNRTRTKVVGRDGTSNFLQGVERCIQMRCKILGLFDAEKIAFTDWREAAQVAGVTESVANKEFESLVSKYTAALGG